jgi:hypothetical protein
MESGIGKKLPMPSEKDGGYAAIINRKTFFTLVFKCKYSDEPWHIFCILNIMKYAFHVFLSWAMFKSEIELHSPLEV